MDPDAEDKLPREYYEAVVSIKTEMEDNDVPDDIVEETLDAIEELIISAMQHANEAEDEIEVETA